MNFEFSKSFEDNFNEKKPLPTLPRIYPGCIYRKYEQRRLSVSGSLERRICFEISNCQNPSHDSPISCSEWEDLNSFYKQGCLYSLIEEIKLDNDGKYWKRICREITGCQNSNDNLGKKCTEWEEITMVNNFKENLQSKSLSGVYCQICTDKPIEDRPYGTECHSCGTYACEEHGETVSDNWYCDNCNP